MVSKKTTRSYGLNNPLQDVFPEPVKAQRAPTPRDLGFEIGQMWVDVTAETVYALTGVNSGSAVWVLMAAGATDLETLTGDTGGAISPMGGNINIVGGDLATIDGAGNTLTVNPTLGGYPITPFVVGNSGEAGYQTIQAALDAANSAGGGVVFIQSGTFTEDLTLYDKVSLFGSSEQNTFIVGTHTPPDSGNLNIFRCDFQDASAIFSSAAAGTTSIIVTDSTFEITDGFTFDLLNWTGRVTICDIISKGPQDGGVRNTGGMLFLMSGGTLGLGTGNTMILSGFSEISHSSIGCPVDFQSANALVTHTKFGRNVELSGASTGSFTNCNFTVFGTAALSINTTAGSSLSSSLINSDNNPAIEGTGSGPIKLTGIDFPTNSAIASTVNRTGGLTLSGSFDTSNEVSGLNMSSNQIQADGTDAIIDVILFPKGDGNVVIKNGSLALTGSGEQLQIEGGAATDFIGSTTLVAGTVTVANTNISTNDKISLTRRSVGASTALGFLSISIINATSFTITSLVLASPGTTETGDVSVVDYSIIRQL